MLIACASPVHAETVTVGSLLTTSMTGKTRIRYGSAPVTVANLLLAAPGAYPYSPISGTVVRWRMAANYLGGPYALRILKPDSSGNYRYGAMSEPTWPTLGPQTIATSLPIEAGDLIGLEVPATNGVPAVKVPNSRTGRSEASPPVPEGATWIPQLGIEEAELGFNADVQPPPTLEKIAPSTGTSAGGTSVTMTGSDFEGATGVKFGDIPAQSFAVNSGGQLTAVAPPSTQVSTVDVSVTTPAGTTSSSPRFTYEACIVPNVRGMKLQAAKNLIKASNCAVGDVRKKKRGRRKGGRLLTQQPAAGTLSSPESKVTVVIGTRRPGHRH